VSVSVFLLGYLFLLLPYISLNFVFEFFQEFPGHPCRICWEGLLLILEEAILEYQSAFLDSFSLQGLIPQETFKQILEYSLLVSMQGLTFLLNHVYCTKSEDFQTCKPASGRTAVEYFVLVAEQPFTTVFLSFPYPKTDAPEVDISLKQTDLLHLHL